uniref:Uncharacterized protein n=1 Tax=Opuntia streptacantha TaxID=393608 RepID=A0A7C8YYB7_OPUST
MLFYFFHENWESSLKDKNKRSFVFLAVWQNQDMPELFGKMLDVAMSKPCLSQESFMYIIQLTPSWVLNIEQFLLQALWCVTLWKCHLICLTSTLIFFGRSD